MRNVDPERDWKTLLAQLPKDYEQLAREQRLVNTQWPNAKIKSAAVLLRFILLHVGADLALRQTVTTMAQAGAPEVSQVWLHQKMRRAHGYLATLVARMMAEDRGHVGAPERWAGYEMLCLDGSTVSGPGAEGADVRMHAVLRLHDLRVRDIHVTSARDGETLRRFVWEADQLVIVDRGYANPPGVASVAGQGADVLVRVNRGALPLHEADGTTIDVLDWCRTLSGHRADERPANVVHGEGRQTRKVHGRLIGFRLSEKDAHDARERVRKEEGARVTDKQLEAAAYVILFTTTPSERLSAARCVEAYRLRWQVELLWKRWKSICHFDALPNYRDDTMLSWLTAKVLLALVLDRIGAAQLASVSHPLARQPYKLTTIGWPLIVGALLPLGLAEAGRVFPVIADGLAILDSDHHRPRQVDAFRDRFYPQE